MPVGVEIDDYGPKLNTPKMREKEDCVVPFRRSQLIGSPMGYGSSNPVLLQSQLWIHRSI